MGRSPVWLNEFDSLRAFAMVGVIWIHVAFFANKMHPTSALTTVCKTTALFASYAAVPLFVFISGFVLYYRYAHIKSLSAFYKRRLMAIVPPYLMLSTFYYFFYHQNVDAASIQQLFIAYLTGNAIVVFWYIVLLIQLYLLYPALASIVNRSGTPRKALVVLCAALLLQFGYAFVRQTGMVNGTVYDGRIFASSIFYFVLGMYLSQKYDVIKNVPTRLQRSWSGASFAVLIVPLLTFVPLAITTMHQPASSLMRDSLGAAGAGLVDIVLGMLFITSLIIVLFVSSVDLRTRAKNVAKVTEKLGAQSFTIYLIHFFVMLELIQVVFPLIHLTWSSWAFYPVLFVATLLLSFVIARALSYLPLSPYIFGSAKSKRARASYTEESALRTEVGYTSPR